MRLVEPLASSFLDHLDHIAQPHDATFPRLEGLAVRPVHRPELDVLQSDVLRGDPASSGRPEDLNEVVGLSSVDDVEDEVGFEILHPHLDRCQVRGRVEEATRA